MTVISIRANNIKYCSINRNNRFAYSLLSFGASRWLAQFQQLDLLYMLNSDGGHRDSHLSAYKLPLSDGPPMGVPSGR
jgi:hypothetical protein